MKNYNELLKIQRTTNEQEPQTHDFHVRLSTFEIDYSVLANFILVELLSFEIMFYS